MNWFLSLNPILQGLLATLFTWSITALGASVVFFFKDVKKSILNSMLGFGAGVMIAASFWSLLSPAIDLCDDLGYNAWLIPSFGFILGGFFIVLSDKFLDKFTFKDLKVEDGMRFKSYKKSILLVLAVTLHNIPEGLAVGVAFGGAALGIPGCTVASAILLAIGIGLQNFPEGAAVSLPLRREGFTVVKSFFYGQASGLVEPIAGVLGVFMAIAMRAVLPILLAFSAGAMIGVVSSELIPEACLENKNLTTVGIIIGFTLMMILDVALG